MAEIICFDSITCFHQNFDVKCFIRYWKWSYPCTLVFSSFTLDYANENELKHELDWAQAPSLSTKAHILIQFKNVLFKRSNINNMRLQPTRCCFFPRSALMTFFLWQCLYDLRVSRFFFSFSHWFTPSPFLIHHSFLLLFYRSSGVCR